VHRKLIAAAAIATAATAMTGLATAGGTVTHQKIVFTYANGKAANMTLTPLTSGSVVADHGSTSWCCWSQKTIQQDGDQLDINNPLATFVGTRGSLIWREQITWHDLPNGYSVATGTWKIVRGTGAYAHVAGHGHLAFISGAGDKVLTYRAVALVANR
jgi:hypothetical protein